MGDLDLHSFDFVMCSAICFSQAINTFNKYMIYPFLRLNSRLLINEVAGTLHHL